MKSTIEQIRKSKSGKTYQVMLMGKWYNASLDCGLDESSKGSYIEADIETTEDFGSWLNEVKVIAQHGGTISEATTPVPVGTPIMRGSGGAGGAFGQAYAYMPFVSNTVAHAIAAGLITLPEQIGRWAKAARNTAIALEMLNDEPGSDG